MKNKQSSQSKLVIQFNKEQSDFIQEQLIICWNKGFVWGFTTLIIAVTLGLFLYSLNINV